MSGSSGSVHSEGPAHAAARPVSTSRAGAVVCVLSAALIAWLGAEVASYSRNTLLNHPEWVNGKLLVSHRIMGSHFAVATRNLLARNRLNLHEWFGYNEVLLDRVFALGSVRVSFRLEEGAYLALLFNRTPSSYCGARLSRRTGRPSAFFCADSAGRFVEKQALDGLSLGPGWHTAVLASRSGRVELEIDGRAAGRFTVEPLTEQVIGFRSGLRGAFVDDVLVTDLDGDVQADEDFRNDYAIWPLRLALFLGALTLLAIAALAARLRGVGRRELLFRLLLGVYLVVLVLVVYLCVDYFYWSSRYPYKAHTPWRPDHEISGLEVARRRVFRGFARFDARDDRGAALKPRLVTTAYPRLRRFLETSDELLGGHLEIFRVPAGSRSFAERVPYVRSDVEHYVERRPLDSTYAILLLGTSQTQGTGASHVEESLAARIYSALEAETERPVAVINAAMRGSHSRELVQHLRGPLLPLEPDLVVANLSNNDALKTFAQGLRGIVRVSRQRGASVLFVLEAKSLEHNLTYIRDNHSRMKRVAAEEGVPVVDLFTSISESERRDEGFIWWDLVHLTSFGQALAAESIAGGILEHFGAELSDGS